MFSTLRLIGLAIITLLSAYLFYTHFHTPYQHFTDQADSFWQGRLDLTYSGTHDTVIRNNKTYWPQGPFPGVLMMPFALIKLNQSMVQLVLVFCLGFLLAKLAWLKGFNREDTLYLTAAFLFSSVAIGLIIFPKSWFFAQTVAMVLLAAILLEWETRKRPLLIGILLGALIATRPFASLILLALTVLLWREPSQWQGRIKNQLYLWAPVGISLLLLLWFNYARFGSPLAVGYATAHVDALSNPVRAMGFFSLKHIPTNIYHYFLTSVTPVTDGQTYHLIFPYYSYNMIGPSFLLVSPFFLYALYSLRIKDTYIRWLWVVSGITMFLLLLYYGTGWRQFGPRYMADFLPILYLLVLYGIVAVQKATLTRGQKNFILISALFNIYLLYTTPLT